MDNFKRVIQEGNPAKPRWWRVTIGRRFTGTGKIRRFFSTEREAKEYIADVVESAKDRGRLAFAIPQALAVEAMELTKQLKPHNTSLTDAVKYFLHHVREQNGMTVDALLTAYLRTKTNPSYRRAQATALHVFAREYGNRSVQIITAADIENWLDRKQWQPLNRRNYIRDISMFFNWAKVQGHVAENPCVRVKRPRVQLSAPEIYTVEETQRLLETARSNPGLALLPMLSLCFFSGIRFSEAKRLTWEMIDWEEREIRLPGVITKSGRPRNIEICDALRGWLGSAPPRRGQIVSPVNLRLRREELIGLADVARKRNALRHSFASYHAAKFRDPGLLQIIMGHQSSSTLFNHYVAATRRSDAEAFFALRPQEEIGKKKVAATCTPTATAAVPCHS